MTTCRSGFPKRKKLFCYQMVPVSRPGQSVDQSGFSLGLFGCRVVQNQTHSDIIKVRSGIGSGVVGFGSDFITVSKTD